MRRSKLLLALDAALLGADYVNASKSVVDACNALSKFLPGDVTFPNSTMYALENTYWSNRQGEVHPHCFVTPRRTADVAVVMKTLTSLGAPFTVKSGGHAAFPGGSNIQDGVTVDLLYMNDIIVSDDRKTVSIGSGNRWINVSHALDPLGLAVVGGRTADVGVSGLLLGGGISYFSGIYGWACDNVRNYEIVLSSGKIANASPTVNPDLYWALRGGGGSNFGIVTRFDLVSFPQGDLWANTLIFPGAMNATLIPLFTDLTVNGLPTDPEAHTYFVLTYQPSLGGYVVLTSLFHATPPPVNTTPPVFAPFKDVPGSIIDATVVANISTQSITIDQPYGSRQTWWDTSVAATSASLLTDIVPLWEAHVSTLLTAATGPDGTQSEMVPFLVFQPIPLNVLSAMQQNGGNALGLRPSNGPLTLVQLTTTWGDSALDSLVEDSSRELIEKIEALADERGLLDGFVYINYAGSTQNVLERYGKENFDRLKKTAKKWDPKGLLQKYWKGYFQVDGEM